MCAQVELPLLGRRCAHAPTSQTGRSRQNSFGHKGKTDVLKGFTTKDGRSYETSLLLDMNSVRIVFPPRNGNTKTI